MGAAQFENFYPFPPGSRIHLNNCVSEDEVWIAAGHYLKLKYEHTLDADEKLSVTESGYIESRIDDFMTGIIWCIILSNIHWGIWDILKVDEAEDADKNTFYP